MISLLLCFITSLTIVVFVTPAIIRVADFKHLFEEPNEKKIHKRRTPRIGGLAIFAAVLIAYSLWCNYAHFDSTRYIIAAIVMLFFVGLKDDIIGVSPYKKLVVQLMAAFIVVVLGNIRITSFYGFLGIHEIVYVFSIIITIFAIIVITNAYNLIDGIDGLAAGLGLITSLTFGTYFYLMGAEGMASLALSLAGALAGILKFNFRPAKLFMGDCGSLVIGFISGIFAIRQIEMAQLVPRHLFDATAAPSNLIENFLYQHFSAEFFQITAIPTFAIAVLIVPLFDTLRVFIVRVFQKRSPFLGDQNHIHYILMSLGYGHGRVAIILYGVNVFFIAIAFCFRKMDATYLMVIILCLALIMMKLLLMARNRKLAYVKKKESIFK
jgi:UDP-GlcNAc:undecaprenyl-phosphate GlcNAc-1-phosphate transferase